MHKRIAPTPLTVKEIAALRERQAKGTALSSGAKAAKVGKKKKKSKHTSEGAATTAAIMQRMPTLGPLLAKADQREKDPLEKPKKKKEKKEKAKDNSVATHIGQGGRRYVNTSRGDRCYIDKVAYKPK